MGTGTATPTSGRQPTAVAKRAVSLLDRRASRWERSMHRRLLGVGHRVECPICGWHGIGFAASRKPRRLNRLCPECTSTERDRALQLWLRRLPPARPGARLLEVAPLGLLAPAARRLGYEYASVDLMSSRASVRGDLCSLPFPTGSFDLVACFHVLEHVGDDVAAVREISRVLTDDGTAVVVVPWDPDAAVTDEDLDAGPEERLRRFGQVDHVRMYGRDTTARFERGDVHVDEVRWAETFGADEFRASALEGDDDRFWFCTPSR